MNKVKVNYETIFENEVFKIDKLFINDNHERTVIKYTVSNVVILPYTVDEKGNIDKILVLNEFNPLRKKEHKLTLITGTEDKNDKTDLQTAIRELSEETGYKITNPSKWSYLGELTTSKIIGNEHPCFAVNITDTKPGTINPKSETEKNSKVELVSLDSLKESSDCFILSLLFKFLIHLEKQN